MEDLTLMTEEGQGIDPTRVLKVAKLLEKQVERANKIMKDLNTFSHSTDHQVMSIHLGELLTLMASLTVRQAAMKNITVEVSSPGATQLHINLLFLESLIYLIIIALIGTSQEGGKLDIRTEINNTAVQIIFTTEPKDQTLTPEIQDDNIQMLAKHLDVSLQSSGSQVSLSIPIEYVK